jgi:hypothetical protein
LRGVGYPKLVIDGMTGHPHDPVRSVDDERNMIAVQSCDFPVNEEVLKLLSSAKAKRPKGITRPAIPHGERPPAPIAPDDRRRCRFIPAHDCTQPGRRRRPRGLSRYDASRFGQRDLSWNRQRIPENVRIVLPGRPGGPAAHFL